MGVFLSKEKTDPNDYEKVLSELDEKIQKVEIKLSDIKVRQRRTGVLVVTYSTLAWLVYVAYCFLSLQQPDLAMDYSMALQIAVILIIPIGIYYLRKGLVWFYARKQTSEETNLTSLRAQQRLKVEELKKKTSYYTTQSLLERYDSEALARKKQQELAKQKQQQQQQQQQQQNQQLRQRKPVSMPITRGMQGPAGNSPQQQQQQQQQHQDGRIIVTGAPMMAPSLNQIQPSTPKGPPQWYDKIIDALIGEEGPETKYALICLHCFAHNGLILPSEVDTIQYTCPNCKKFNPSRKSRQLRPDGPVLPPRTPSPMSSPVARHALLPSQPKGYDIGQHISDVDSNHEDDDDDTSIAARVRQRRETTHPDNNTNGSNGNNGSNGSNHGSDSNDDSHE